MRVIIFFLTVASLSVWLTGCYTCFPTPYELTISSTEDGSVTNPGERTFTYNAGTAVSLVATPDAGYCFVNWTGDVSTIDDVNAASTTITMNGDYSITANFVQGQPIRTWYDLDAVRNNLSDSYLLMNDLDSTTAGYTELASPTANSGKGWEPIGTYNTSFIGTFDGQGYEISDLFIDRPGEHIVALFCGVGVGGVIDNVGVVNANVIGIDNIGGLVGWNMGNVSNSYSTGSVTGGLGAGGLIGGIGGNSGIVSNSFSTASVSGSSLVGGLVGYSYGTVSNSFSTGNVTGNSSVGGLIAQCLGTVSNSYSTASVSGEEYVGGLVGYNNGGNVTNSYSTGSVTGNNFTGGLVGDSYDSTVTNSFWDTETSGQNTSAGGTGKNTTEMQNIVTFSGAGWDIIGVVNPSTRNTTYIWNIVNNVTYPFLSWQPV